jgi:hypothetical protein
MYLFRVSHIRIYLLLIVVMGLLFGFYIRRDQSSHAANPQKKPIIRINFQPDSSRMPDSFDLIDSGDPFNELRGYGWIREDSLFSSTRVPVDIRANGRERGRSGIAPELDTFVYMAPLSIADQSVVRVAAVWEYMVANGNYRVTVSAGDGPPYDSDNVITVEGTTAIDHFKPKQNNEYQQKSVRVTVNDGRLTVDSIGGINTTINFIEVQSLDFKHPDNSRGPKNLDAVPGKDKVKLHWDEVPDAVGYNIYKSTSLPVNTSGSPINNRPHKRNSYDDNDVINGVTYYYKVAAISADNTQEMSVTMNATPSAAMVTSTEIKVNFSDASTVPPAGYLRDFGEAYGTRTGNYQGSGMTYGWVKPNTTTPVSLVGWGRNRTGATQTDVRLLSLIHMQKSPGGSWEIALPNGSYNVTVTVGDAGYIDSTHVVYIEGQLAINRFIPKSTDKFLAATKVVNVADGRLTVSASGAVTGTNTKLTHIVIRNTSSTSQPSVTATSPTNGQTNVRRDNFISAEVSLPNVGQGIDTEALTEASVKLIRVSDGYQVPASLNTSGGGDVIVLQPGAILSSSTQYSFRVLNGLTDTGGSPFVPVTINFTTGTCCTPTSTTISFQKVSLSNATLRDFTTVVIGPDQKLYAGTIKGEILRFGINSDGTLGTPQVITSLQEHNGGARALIGMVFAPGSTATNLVLWTSHNGPSLSSAPDWTGKITRMSGANLEFVQDYVVGLPRSVRDHLTNSMAFGPDGALYVNQGSISAMGAPDNAWGQRPERLLSGATLRVNLTAITSAPLNVKTQDGGSYNPFATGAPVTIYGSGVRNAYDLLWHSNGQLYVPTNGSAAGGNTPGTPSPLPSSCANRIDDATFGDYTGPTVPAITNVTVAQNDFLFRVVKGGYYGHPNPLRCEWVLNGGNPTSSTDTAQVSQYPVGTRPDRNWRGASFDFKQHYSPNGVIEYKSSHFNGQLKGKILVVRYSGGDDIIALTPSATTFDITSSQTGIPGFTGFTDPLDLVENTANGYIYVAEYGARRITLLRPQ